MDLTVDNRRYDKERCQLKEELQVVAVDHLLVLNLSKGHFENLPKKKKLNYS
jgi:hypothetical protein